MDWKDISIRKYNEIVKVLDDDIDDLDKNLQLLSIVRDMDIDEVESLPLLELGKMMKDIQFINNQPKHNGKIKTSSDYFSFFNCRFPLWH